MFQITGYYFFYFKIFFIININLSRFPVKILMLNKLNQNYFKDWCGKKCIIEEFSLKIDEYSNSLLGLYSKTCIYFHVFLCEKWF